MLGPVLVQTLEFEVADFSYEEIEARIQDAITKLPWSPRPEDKSIAVTGTGKPKMFKLHTDMIFDFGTHFFDSLEERYKRMGNIHPEYFNRLLKDLQEAGFLGPKQKLWPTKRKGRPPETCFITPKGAEILGLEYAKCIPPGRGSALHRQIQLLLKKRLGHGAVVEFENADVVHYTKDENVAYEIELDVNEHIVENIHRDLARFSRVEVLARKHEDVKAIRELVWRNFDPETIERAITFRTISEALEDG